MAFVCFNYFPNRLSSSEENSCVCHIPLSKITRSCYPVIVLLLYMCFKAVADPCFLAPPYLATGSATAKSSADLDDSLYLLQHKIQTNIHTYKCEVQVKDCCADKVQSVSIHFKCCSSSDLHI